MKEQIEKQAIEEIDSLTTVLYEANHKKSVLDYHWLATEAYNAGYRKQSKGEWIEHIRISKEGKPLLRHYQCNLCDVYLATRANFCPNCGAKMKGGAE